MSKHTPGPWHVTGPSAWEPVAIYENDKLGRTICDFANTPHSVEEVEANAHLIATAPELLEAVKEAWRRNYNAFEPDNQSAFYHRLEALIKKAEGAMEDK